MLLSQYTLSAAIGAVNRNRQTRIVRVWGRLNTCKVRRVCSFHGIGYNDHWFDGSNVWNNTMWRVLVMQIRRVITVAILTVCFVAVLLGCAMTKKAYVPGEDEELYGTWYNEENDEVITYRPDGHFEDFFGKSNFPRWYGTFTITVKWVDGEGNVWYRTIVENQVGVTRYVLNRIGDFGTILENAFFSNNYPDELDSNLMSYRTFVRSIEIP
jgi:hypothetical protein